MSWSEALAYCEKGAVLAVWDTRQKWIDVAHIAGERSSRRHM